MTTLSSRFSLFRVVDVRRSDYLDLEDLLIGAAHHVPGRIESSYFEAGDIVYARVVSIDGEATLLGSAPWCVPAEEPFDIDTLRRRRAEFGNDPGEAALRGFDRELRLRFFAAIRDLYEGLHPTEDARHSAGRPAHRIGDSPTLRPFPALLLPPHIAGLTVAALRLLRASTVLPFFDVVARISFFTRR